MPTGEGLKSCLCSRVSTGTGGGGGGDAQLKSVLHFEFDCQI